MTRCDDESMQVFPESACDRGADMPPCRCAFSSERHGIRLYHADCLEFMDLLLQRRPHGVFDMVFSDPPYFLSNGGITCHAGKRVKVDKGQWDKSQGPELNHEFNVAWLSRCQRLLAAHGTIWVSGTHHVIHSIGYAMQQLGMRILNDISWEKPNPPPNLSCRYFTHSTETILWAARDEKAKHVFNYDLMRKMNGGKQMKTVWTLSVPNGKEKQFGKHPTQKPVELIERLILASTHENALILDPFAGSATTGVAAVNLRRRFVGVEIDPDFVRFSVERLRQAVGNRDSSFDFSLIEEGSAGRRGGTC